MARNISFTICFLMLFCIVVDHDTEEMISTFTYTSVVSEFLMRIAAAAQLLVTLWFMVIWISLRKPLALKKYDLAASEEKEEKSATAALETKKKDYS